MKGTGSAGARVPRSFFMRSCPSFVGAICSYDILLLRPGLRHINWNFFPAAVAFELFIERLRKSSQIRLHSDAQSALGTQLAASTVSDIRQLFVWQRLFTFGVCWARHAILPKLFRERSRRIPVQPFQQCSTR